MNILIKYCKFSNLNTIVWSKIKKAIKTCSFRNLQQLEKDGKFKEQTVDKQNKSVKFFHLGPENDWKKILDKNISREIENKFKAEMEELGYLWRLIHWIKKFSIILCCL